MGIKNMKTHSCYIFSFIFFKWFEKKELAKIQWAENYKQDFNFVALKSYVYIIYMEHYVLLKPFFSLQQSSLGIYRP